MSNADPVSRLLERIPGGAKPAGRDQWRAKCPAHDDRQASLMIRRGDDGRALLNCQAGCDTAVVVGAMGLRMKDLMPDSNGHAAGNGHKRIVAEYGYFNAEGELVYQSVRFTPKSFMQRRPDPDKPGGWLWNMQGVERVLYHLPRLIDADPKEFVFVVEGEKDADLLSAKGLISTTNVGGAGKWKGEDGTRYTETLRGRRLVLIPDNDDAGRDHVREITRMCRGIAEEIRVVVPPGIEAKGDVSDWFNAGGTAERLLALVEDAKPWDGQGDPIPYAPPPYKSVRQLMREYPQLRDPIIEGLLRRGETMNIIAPPKTGKSWLVNGLAIAVATSRVWLDKFPTIQGKVLILDNELHGETSANRIPKVARSMGVLTDEIADYLFIHNLRGQLKDIYSMSSYFDTIKSGSFRVIILDAFYRFMPAGSDENDNSQLANVYNSLDRYADKLGCAFILIHHSSKGNQSEKSVTDVGSGAGSQSRAADTHLILRQHEEEGVVVLDAAVRSWPPFDPFCLRWTFPTWTPDGYLDPSRLKRPGGKSRTRAEEPAATIPPGRIPWTVENFVKTFVSDQPKSLRAITAAASVEDLSNRRIDGFIALAEENRLIHRWAFEKDNKVYYATRTQDNGTVT